MDDKPRGVSPGLNVRQMVIKDIVTPEPCFRLRATALTDAFSPLNWSVSTYRVIIRINSDESKKANCHKSSKNRSRGNKFSHKDVRCAVHERFHTRFEIADGC